jgi:glycerophosphoryl diester phosphodiesterase
VNSRLGPLVFLGLIALTSAEGQSLPSDFDVQGHRGCRGLAPENTLPAFEKAIELGVTTLELDIQEMLDGTLVVHHDKRLNPKLCISADGQKIKRQPLASLSYPEIANLDCGSRRLRQFPQQTLAPGAHIPMLEEVLEMAAAAPYPVWLSIEIKQPAKELPLSLGDVVDRLVDLVDRHDLIERTIIQSESGAVLSAIRQQAPQLERSLVIRWRSGQRWVEDGTVTVVSRKYLFLRRSQVAKLQQRGVRVIPWTVNNPKKLRKLLEWGVDGVITDYPDRALELVRP